MSFQLKSDEALQKGIRRLAAEQGSLILRLIQENDEAHKNALHEARKGVKRIRALLKLVRDQFSSENFKKENQCYRKIGKALSPPRDAEVLVDALEKLQKDCIKSRKANFVFARKSLVERRASALKDFSAIRGKVAQPLLQALQRIEKWPLRNLGCKALLSGLERTYKKSRTRFHESCENPDAENLHAWRKRVKDFWYELCILKSQWPREMKKMVRAAQELSELIGDEHDLFMLAKALEYGGLGSGKNTALTKLIQKRRKEIQKKALKLGQKLFAEKPNAFAAKIEACSNA